MSNNFRWMPVLIFAGGLAAGALAGNYYGSKAGTAWILDLNVDYGAQQTHFYLDALRNLRSGKTAETIEAVESRLDDQLVLFAPDEPYPISADTLSRVDKAILAAKAYRTEHPRSSKRTFVDKTVQSLFERKRQSAATP